MKLMLTIIMLSNFLLNCTESKSRKAPAEKPAENGQVISPVYTPFPSPSPVAQQTESNRNECYRADATICAAERSVTELTNDIRRLAGKSVLVHDAKLSFTARQWSDQQAAQRRIGHAGFPNARMRAFLQEFGNGNAPSMDGENVAMSYIGRSTNPGAIAQEFIDMWKTSSGHYRNIVGRHQLIGVGISRSNDGSYYATQIFGSQ